MEEEIEEQSLPLNAEGMKEQFVPQLNEFMELLKEANKSHVEHLVKLGEWQKNMLHEHKKLVLKWQMEDKPALANETEYLNFIKEQVSYCQDFERQAKHFRVIFQDHIEDTNFMLGKISNHWGGFIEGIGVQYLSNYLRKEFGAHTFIEKFKRYWHKSRNVEIDLLALSDTHAYLVEAKHHLRDEHAKQLQTTIEKFKDKMPEYGHLTIQPILFCIHANQTAADAIIADNWWLLRYQNFDRVKPLNSFVWLNNHENNESATNQ